MVPGVGYGANALNTRTSLDAPHPSPLPLWGEGVALFEAPHPSPLPCGERGLLFSRPSPPVGRGGCSFRGPSPQPSPLRGEGVPDNWPVPVITVGRQFGAGGATVGRMLADELKADVLDSNIIDEVARRLQLPKEEVEAEDEQPGSLLARLLVALGSASTEPLIPPEATAWTPPNAAPTFDTRKAVLQITQHVIEEAARAGNVVIVGRGGAYILAKFPGALHLFLRAAEAARVKTVMARFSIASEDEARRRIKQADENWTSYIKQVYGHDRNHPAHYDMVLDTGRLGYDATVDAVLAALKRRKSLT